MEGATTKISLTLFYYYYYYIISRHPPNTNLPTRASTRHRKTPTGVRRAERQSSPGLWNQQTRNKEYVWREIVVVRERKASTKAQRPHIYIPTAYITHVARTNRRIMPSPPALIPCIDMCVDMFAAERNHSGDTAIPILGLFSNDHAATLPVGPKSQSSTERSVKIRKYQ